MPEVSVDGPELLVLVLLVVAVAIPILTLIDIVSKPAWAFEQAGQNRTMCIVFTAGGIPFCGLGLLVAAVWFVGVRPSVVAAADGMPPEP